MKKLFLLLAFTLPAFAQSNRVYTASTYAYTTQVNGGNPSTGSSSLSASPTAFAQGIPFSPYNTNASISINRNAANAETVTPSAVTNCFPNGAGCTLSSTFTFKHITGESIQSGTFGLQEAINIAMAAGSGTVLIDSTWQGPAGASLITAAKGNNNVMIQDNRNPSGAVFYQWGGSAYAQAGGGVATNSPVNMIPVEQFGAVADYPGTGTGVGTDNTTAIQNCINYLQTTVGSGQCLLKVGKYRITSAINITKSSVGIAGSAYGALSTAISNQLVANAPVSAIYIDSATADAIDVNASGSLGSPVSFNKFNDFTIMRTQAATNASSGCGAALTGPAGLSIQYAGGFVVDRVWSEDSACPFYFQNAGAYGTGYVSNSGAMWGANGFNPAIPVYGFFVRGINSMESFRLRDSFAQTVYPGFSGVQSVGLIVTGANINDIFVRGFETAFVTYGEYIQYTGGSASAVANSDIHLIDCVNDTFFQDGIVLDGLINSQSSEIEVKGGWNSTGNPGSSNNSAGIWIKGSSGVTVTAVGFINLAAIGSGQKYGILGSTGTITRLAITGNNFFNIENASIALNTVSGAALTGNVIYSTAGDTQSMIQGLSLTRSSIAGNALSGTASFGITLDAASSNNDVEGLSSIDPTSITTPYVNSGVNNGIAQTTFLSTATQTTVSCSTSGTAKFSEPEQGSSNKRVIIHLTACLGTASFTYPAAFTNTPSVYASNNVAASVASAVSTTAVTVTGTTSTGSLVLEDY